MNERLERFAAAERPRIEAALGRGTKGLAPPLADAAAYVTGGGGKRVRPLLVVAAWRTVAEEAGEAAPTALYDVAAAVELVHTYSLVHDDLPFMDDDDLRRGRPTLHRAHGVALATATGAALQHRAFLALARAATGDARVARALPALARRLAVAAGVEGMVGGQYLDLAAEGRAVDAAGLEAIHRGKTAALLSAACAMGGMAAGAAADAIDALGGYGAALGLAFQIVDDLLDETGDPERMGKATGADRARAKATYPSVHGLDGARDQAERAVEAARADLARLAGEAPLLDDFLDFVLERLH